MKIPKVVLFIAVIIVFAGFFLFSKDKGNKTTSTTENGLQSAETTTAKKAYDLALKEAKKFSSDCYLVELNTSKTQNDGKSRSWFITFYSPSKNTNFKVNIVEAKVDKTDDTNKNKADKVADNWVDSDQAAKTALPQCGTVIENEYFFGLDADNNQKQTEWSIHCTVGENKTLRVILNGQTGEFLRTSKAGIGW